MQTIHIYEAAWSTTFPNLVTPLKDEWFPGLLLRCDVVNDWSNGTTLAHLLRSVNSYPLRGKPNWIVVPATVLELLAQLLAKPTRKLVATTFNEELARLYNTSSPHSTYLNRSFLFHICPDCIAEKRLLYRIFALPNITCCPFHKIQLVKSCQCGETLQIFHKQAPPFICKRCSSDWNILPRVSADSESLALVQKFLLHYDFFFTKGTPTLLAKAHQLIRERVKRLSTPRVRCPNGIIKYVECYDRKRVSLGSLIELLVSLELFPCDVESYDGFIPWWSVKTQHEEKI